MTKPCTAPVWLRGDTLPAWKAPPTALAAVDIAEILYASDLSSQNRRHVYNAVFNSLIDWWPI